METTPILTLGVESEIKSLFYDSSKNIILIGTSDGRIIKMAGLASNAYLTGPRNIFAQAQDPWGNTSETSWLDILYALTNKIFEVFENKNINKWKTVSKPLAANSVGSISGIFTSPILWAGEDFIRWNSISLDKNVPAGCRISLLARAGKSLEDIEKASWEAFDSSGAIIGLDAFSDRGSYFQARIVMETSETDITPIVNRLSVSYESKFALFFFTTKIVMEKDTKLNSGFVTCHMTVPQKTEVKFGVAGTNTVDWEDYIVIEPDKAFEIPESFNNKVKIGIKLMSYSDTNLPVVDEFAITFGADKYNHLNG